MSDIYVKTNAELTSDMLSLQQRVSALTSAMDGLVAKVQHKRTYTLIESRLEEVSSQLEQISLSLANLSDIINEET